MSEHEHAHHHHHPAEGDDLITCPVMPHNLVNKQEAEELGLYRDFEGERYWFCCSSCESLWDAEPRQYANAG